MKLGFLTAPFSNQPLAETVRHLRSLYTPNVLQALELGTGNYPGNGHCDPELLLRRTDKREDLAELLADNAFEISALSCHGNPVHPNPKIAKAHHKVQDQTIKLAGEMGIETVVTFSGLQGDGRSITPIWVTFPWPDEQRDLYLKQLGEQIAYWDGVTREAHKRKVRLAIELHPNMFMHNVETFKAVKEGVKARQGRKDGSKAYQMLGTNPDFSHLTWRGMNLPTVIRELESDVFYIHAKDVLTNKAAVALNGSADAGPFSKPLNRASSFVRVGSGDVNWPEAIRELRRAGYDGTVSIEHEDGEMDAAESLDQAINYLHPIIPRKAPGPMTWAER